MITSYKWLRMFFVIRIRQMQKLYKIENNEITGISCDYTSVMRHLCKISTIDIHKFI